MIMFVGFAVGISIVNAIGVDKEGWPLDVDSKQRAVNGDQA